MPNQKMPRKLKKWFKKNLQKFFFVPSALSWVDRNKMDKLFHGATNA
jgi:hypothetical protein